MDTQTSFDFAELLTVASRHVLRVTRHRPLAFSFDHRGPLPVVQGDSAPVRRSLHRLFGAVIAVVESGWVEFDGEARLLKSGVVEVHVKAVGCGRLTTAERVSAVLARLQLAEERGAAIGEPSLQPRFRRASGWCPIAGVPVQFAIVPSVGFVFSAQWSWPASQVAIAERSPDLAERSCAWVVDFDDFAAASVARRLQRLGWETSTFLSCADADRRLQAMKAMKAMKPKSVPPSLLLIGDSQATSLLALQALRDQLPDGTRCLYGIAPGSISLLAAAGLAGFDRHVLPLSPKVLQSLAAGPCAAAGPSSPALLPKHYRPLTA